MERRLLPLALIGASFLFGCDGSLPVASFVEKLRVLAVAAEPPEPAPGERTTLRALAVEPERTASGTAPLSAVWLACRAPAGATSVVPCGLGLEAPLGASLPPPCGDQVDGSLCLLGTELDASLRPARALLDSSGGATLYISVAIADTARGAAACYLDTAHNGGLPTEPDRCVLAVKRLRVRDPLRANGGPSNRNPALARLELIDEDGTVRSLIAGEATLPPPSTDDPPPRHLRSQRDEASTEQASDGRYEALSLSWFTTGGLIRGGRSSFDPPGCVTQDECASQPPVTNATTIWQAPTPSQAAAELGADGRVRIWAVLRDDRGGVAWQEGALYLR